MSRMSNLKERTKKQVRFDGIAIGADAPRPILASASDENESRRELWGREEEGWELTWPIWHMLPRAERKALALQHGFQKIGEFEEYMTLQRAVGDSSEAASRQKPYENNMIYGAGAALPRETERAEETATSKQDHDGEDGESLSDDRLGDEMGAEQLACAEDMTTKELLEAGGQILILPDDMLHRIFDWLYVDSYATLALVSPYWKSFTRTETVYKRLCERLYLNQSKRRTLHVSRFGNSYRTMLEKRPRVRAGGGAYVMKYARVKKIQRDMWTEIPLGAVLETVYYRYIYFQEDGRVLYALTTAAPHEMFGRFLKVCLTKQGDPVAVWGTYQVQKRRVTVTAQQEWQHVQLDLTIQTDETLHGRNGLLTFDRHWSSSSGDFSEWSRDRQEFEVPGEPFRFVRDDRL